MSLLEKARQRYQSGAFIKSPEGDYPADTLTLLHESRHRDEAPEVSIVTPIHNQKHCIEKHLQAILDCTTVQRFEMILILDACSDGSTEIVQNWCKNLGNKDKDNKTPPNLTKLVLFHSSMPLFETAADNLGFYCAEGDFVLEIQADMEIVQKGYNLNLCEPFKYFEHLLGVSGRGCHTFLTNQSAGRCTQNIEYPLPPEVPRNLFYVTDTCNRGPLMLHRAKLVEMGYMDERNHFLDYSDHDLFARAYAQKGWTCGYIPVDYVSKLVDGSTRKARDALNQEHYERKKAIQMTGGSDMHAILRRMVESGENRGFIVYNLPTITVEGALLA